MINLFKLFQSCQEHILLKLRFLHHKKHFRKHGQNIKIYGRIKVLGNKIELGNHITINEGVFISARDLIKIGDYCRLSPYVQLHTGGLNLDQPYQERGHYNKPIYIENGVWLCASVIVNPGMKIGQGAVVLPGSVVSQDIPPFELWGGVPAEKIKDLSKLGYETK